MKLILLLSIVLIFSAGTISAQVLYVNQTNGTQTEFDVSYIRKITLPDNNVTIVTYGGTEESFSMTDLNYLSFTDYTNSIEELKETSGNLSIYPVPATDVLKLRYASAENKEITIRITNVQGAIVKTLKKNVVQGIMEMDIDVKDLPEGFYNCSLDNGKLVQSQKFLKK